MDPPRCADFVHGYHRLFRGNTVPPLWSKRCGMIRPQEEILEDDTVLTDPPYRGSVVVLDGAPYGYRPAADRHIRSASHGYQPEAGRHVTKLVTRCVNGSNVNEDNDTMTASHHRIECTQDGARTSQRSARSNARYQP